MDLRWHVQDIEDLVLDGQETVYCPYYLQIKRVENADLVLMPYSYLINPSMA